MHLWPHSRTLVALLAFSVALNYVSADSESDPDPTGASDLEAEHRGAKTEPFLDRIASFFGGGEKKNKPSPVYQRPGLQAQASQQRPVVATRPNSGYAIPPTVTATYGAPAGSSNGALQPPVVRPPARAPPPPVTPTRSPAYQPPVAASNNFPTYVSPGNTGESFSWPNNNA